MHLKKAVQYLNDVLAHRRCIPYRRFTGHVGRNGQAIEFGVVQGRWPEKSIKVVLGLLQNLEANANVYNKSYYYIYLEFTLKISILFRLKD